MIIILFIIGLLLIIKGGDWFVDAASWIAEKSGIPKFIIGATIVSIATTLPELIVSIIAAVEGHGHLVSGDNIAALESVDMAIGNAIGSVNANSGLIMALSLIFMPVAIKRKEFWIKPVLLLATIVILFLASLKGELTPVGAIFVLLMLVIFFVENTITAKKQMNLPADEEETEVAVTEEEAVEEPKGFFNKLKAKYEIPFNIVMFILGAAGIVIGARLLVDKGTQIAIMLNVPTKIIALTMVAIGTSLPELVTTISAIVKKQSDLSVGNIIGANLIDMALILPVCSFIFGAGLPVSNNVLYLDMAFAFGLVAIAVVPALIRGKFSRVQGFIIFAAYVTYIVLSSILVL
ncbi:MAG: calcium/sodium antiporter [Bacilli bacterium]|nr:calcium/sodium antiporter [Bacilli bacterium]